MDFARNAHAQLTDELRCNKVTRKRLSFKTFETQSTGAQLMLRTLCLVSKEMAAKARLGTSRKRGLVEAMTFAGWCTKVG